MSNVLQQLVFNVPNHVPVSQLYLQTYSRSCVKVVTGRLSETLQLKALAVRQQSGKGHRSDQSFPPSGYLKHQLGTTTSWDLKLQVTGSVPLRNPLEWQRNVEQVDLVDSAIQHTALMAVMESWSSWSRSLKWRSVEVSLHSLLTLHFPPSPCARQETQ